MINMSEPPITRELYEESLNPIAFKMHRRFKERRMEYDQVETISPKLLEKEENISENQIPTNA